MISEAKSESAMFRLAAFICTFFRLFIGYLLMLIAMTYNGGLVLAIVLGLSTSYLIFGANSPSLRNEPTPCLPNSADAQDEAIQSSAKI